MCTGKTHLLYSSAVVATPLVLTESWSGQPTSDLDRSWLGMGLLLVGIVGGLFPDLDAPESELLHAPRKLARTASWALVSAFGRPKSSLFAAIVRALFWLPGVVLGSLITGLSVAIRSVSHHRGLTHELRGLAIFTGLVVLLASTAATICQLPTPLVLHTTMLVGGAWSMGYLSHLLLDAATISGIPLLSSRGTFHLLPRGWRFRTGTWPDVLLLRGVAIAWLFTLLLLAFAV